MKHIVEFDARCRFSYGNNVASEHIQDLAHALSQIPRVVEFLQSGEKEVWGDLRQAGWRRIDWGHGLYWDFLGDYVCVTEICREP